MRGSVTVSFLFFTCTANDFSLLGQNQDVVNMNKTNGAMICFANAEDDDLMAVIAVLRRMIEDISDKPME